MKGWNGKMVYLKNFMDLYQLLFGLLRINFIFKELCGFKEVIMGVELEKCYI
jgi:hypothetical protein